MKKYNQAPIITVKRIPKFGALMIWPFIVIELSKAYNQSLLEHEYAHWKQALRYGILFWYFLYFLSKKHRLRFELEAYRAQGCNDRYIAYQLTKYRLGIKYDEAYRLVRG